MSRRRSAPSGRPLIVQSFVLYPLHHSPAGRTVRGRTSGAAFVENGFPRRMKCDTLPRHARPRLSRHPDVLRVLVAQRPTRLLVGMGPRLGVAPLRPRDEDDQRRSLARDRHDIAARLEAKSTSPAPPSPSTGSRPAPSPAGSTASSTARASSSTPAPSSASTPTWSSPGTAIDVEQACQPPQGRRHPPTRERRAAPLRAVSPTATGACPRPGRGACGSASSSMKTTSATPSATSRETRCGKG